MELDKDRDGLENREGRKKKVRTGNRELETFRGWKLGGRVLLQYSTTHERIHKRSTTMGKLIKNHWARLIVLTAAVCMYYSDAGLFNGQRSRKDEKEPWNWANHDLDQVAAALESFFWPKIFWDFLTKTLDPAVKPVPVLQIINLLLGLGMFALEWPLSFIAGSTFHRSLEARLALLPLAALAAVLIYQGTNPALYYLTGSAVYFWAYSEGEVCV